MGYGVFVCRLACIVHEAVCHKLAAMDATTAWAGPEQLQVLQPWLVVQHVGRRGSLGVVALQHGLQLAWAVCSYSISLCACAPCFCDAGLHGLLKVVGNWTYSLFFCMAELWGAVVISVLFW